MPRVVNFLNPIRRQAPLNKGLLRWWLAEPFRNHSPRLQDLTRKSPMTLSGALRLGPRGRPGGFGSSVFNGSSDYGQTAAIDLSGLTTMTVSFWLYWDTFGTDNKLAIEASADSNTAANVGAVLLMPNFSSGIFYLRLRASNAAGTTGLNAYSFTRPAGAAWQHYAICYNRDGGAQQITAAYVNGVSQSLTSINTQSASTGGFGNFVWNFMARNGGASGHGAGRLGDIRIYNRVLPAWEPRALLHASRRGYPQELRYSRPSELLSTEPAGGGGATNSFWLRSRGRPCWPQTE